MIVPGLVAVIMMIISALLTSLTIAREWERGTMEQLVSTPVRREEIVLGKLLPYVAIGLVVVAIVSILGIVVFGVPFRGNPFLLFVLSLFFLLGALGVGMFISRARAWNPFNCGYRSEVSRSLLEMFQVSRQLFVRLATVSISKPVDFVVCVSCPVGSISPAKIVPSSVWRTIAGTAGLAALRVAFVI